MGEVEREIQCLDKAIIRMKAASEQMCARIGTILAPETPKPGPIKEPNPPTTVPLAQQLERMRVIVDCAVQDMEDVLARIEL
jgi:hypothetical protein